MSTLRLPAHFYQQFDADYSRDVPGESYGGWQSADIELAPQHTAVVVMHAWDAGTPEKYPGWWRCGEFLARDDKIVKNVFPSLLKAVRASELKLFHVVAGGEHYQQYPGYKRAVELSGAAPVAPEQIPGDPMLQKLQQFRADHGVIGAHNREDVARGFQNLDFPREARPLGDEGIAENAQQLFALCKS